MGRSRPPRKPYRPKTSGSSTPLRAQPWRLENTFRPLRAILEHVARGGELHATEQGAWIYVSPTRHQAYEVPATLRAYAKVFAVLRMRDPQCPDVEPLRCAALDINTGAVTEAVVQAALACLDALWAYSATQPADVIADAAQSVTLRANLNALDQAQSADPAVGEGEGSAPSA
ncbi:hypothetical protein [Ralstonia holmesii]|uniref:hypothetical protein n=1 Tax=Ralstonia holmesii TaxID=3058602 RepID=UPI003D650312